MYDWANSSFFTSAAVAIAPIYFVQLFTNSLGNSVEIFGFNITSSSTWSFGVAFSALIVAISTPFIGIIADRTKIKKKLLIETIRDRESAQEPSRIILGQLLKKSFFFGF